MSRTRHFGWLVLVLSVAVSPLPAGESSALTVPSAAEGWMPLFDGVSTSGWVSRDGSHWAVREGELRTVAGSPGGFLATTREFSDFRLHIEFWVDARANSGVFLRCPVSGEITSLNSYEVNIFDPHPKWPTGSISEVARAAAPQATVGRWNTYDITAEGDRLVVVLNGVQTVEARDAQHVRGVIALQHLKGEGEVRFRNIRLQPWNAAKP